MARKREYPRNFYLSWVGKDDLDALEPRPPKCEHGQFEEGDSPWWPPGTPWVRPPGTTERLVNLGPTLTALFHPKSWFCNFLLRWPKPDEPDQLDRVFLLHLPGDDVNKLREAIHKIARYRLSKNSHLSKKEQEALKSVLPEKNGNSKLLQFVPIDAQPTQHKEIAEGIRRWLDEKNPLDRHRAKYEKEVFINLSPGTPAMHATWLILYGQREFFRGASFEDKISVTFVEGDGGPLTAKYASDEQRQPVVELKFDPFRLVVPPSTTDEEPPPDELELNQLESRPYERLCKKLERAAQLRIPVVLVGERGTGKTMLARYYHRVRWEVAQSNRQPEASSAIKEMAQEKYANFAVVSLSEFDSVELLRSELFGWKKGSFTDAHEDYDGLLGKADGGTLFLDEVHHLHKSLQAALLRPLNDGTYHRRGDDEIQHSDFDLVTATNRCNDWETYLAEDFLDRIKGVVLRVPPFAQVLRFDQGFQDLRKMFRYVLNRQCSRSRVEYREPPKWFWTTFWKLLEELPEERKLPGNWRDLYLLARHVLLHCADPSGISGQVLNWNKTEQVKRALGESLGILVLGEGA